MQLKFFFSTSFPQIFIAVIRKYDVLTGSVINEILNTQVLHVSNSI